MEARKKYTELKEQIKDLGLMSLMITIIFIPVPGSGLIMLKFNNILKKLNIEPVSNLKKIQEVKNLIVQEYKKTYLKKDFSLQSNKKIKY